MSKPLAIDLFCGLGGWTEGLLAEGYEVVGFDIERRPYPAQLVLQDVLTLDGRQFRDAALIVASPPCQEYSYMAMPWTRAKQIARALRGHDEFPEGYIGSRTIEQLNTLFDACFRIAREAGVPLVVENVRGAQPWVGPARWNYGSFYLWGDVPAIMPVTFEAIKGPSLGWFNDEKRKGAGSATGYLSQSGSKSDSRKAASALIAKIPFPLARHIARVYKPIEAELMVAR